MFLEHITDTSFDEGKYCGSESTIHLECKKKMVALSTMLEYLPDALKKLHKGTLISSLHTRLYRFTSNCHVPSSYKEA